MYPRGACGASFSMRNSDVNVEVIESAPQKPSTTACQKTSEPFVFVQSPVDIAAIAVAAKLAQSVPYG